MRKYITVLKSPWEVEVAVGDNFEPLEVGHDLLNCGSIEYKDPWDDNHVYWDNISAFIVFSKKLKKKCKKELMEKGLYKKGIFKPLKEIIQVLIEKKFIAEL